MTTVYTRSRTNEIYRNDVDCDLQKYIFFANVGVLFSFTSRTLRISIKNNSLRPLEMAYDFYPRATSRLQLTNVVLVDSLPIKVRG